VGNAPPTREGRANAARELGLHPLAAEAAAAAHELEGGGVAFSDSALDALRDAVRALEQDPGLEHALRSLVALAAHVDEELGCEAEALRLLEVAAEGAPALQRQKSERRVGAQDAAEKVTGALRRFTGRQEKKRAPMQDGATPAEGVKLDSLFRPRNITGR
jgi:hypothetical protein